MLVKASQSGNTLGKKSDKNAKLKLSDFKTSAKQNKTKGKKCHKTSLLQRIKDIKSNEK